MKHFLVTVLLILGIRYTLAAQDFANLQESVLRICDVNETQIELLQEWHMHPCNINAITESDCKNFFFLSDFEQKSLWFFISKNKPLLSIFELQYVLGLPIEKVKILQMICVVEVPKPYSSLKEMLDKGDHTISLYQSTPIASYNLYDSISNYQGSPIKQSLRYRYNAYNKVLAGITLKSDAGEQIWLRNKGVYDFQSIYLQITTNTDYKILIGDYELSIGKGLMVNQSGFWGTGARSLLSPHLLTVKKHSGSNEHAFFRGIALQKEFGAFQLTPFISAKHIDGKVSSDSIFPFQLYTDGYHRNTTELQRKQAILKSTVGLGILYTKKSSVFGLVPMYTQFSQDSVVTKLPTVSVLYAYAKEKKSVRAELSFDYSGKIASSVSLESQITADALYGAIARYYAPNYSSFDSQTYGEQSAPQNEMGLYQFVQMPFVGMSKLELFADIYYLPQFRYFVHSPTRGNSIGAKWSYSNFDGIKLLAQAQFERKTESADSEYTKAVQDITKLYTKFHCEIPLMQNCKFITGLHYSLVSQEEDSKGILLFEDIVYESKHAVKYRFRYALFSAPYDARLYAWDANVRYAYSLMSYFYEGSQLSATASYTFAKHFSVDCKISKVWYTSTYSLPEEYAMYTGKNPFGVHVYVGYGW